MNTKLDHYQNVFNYIDLTTNTTLPRFSHIKLTIFLESRVEKRFAVMYTYATNNPKQITLTGAYIS